MDEAVRSVWERQPTWIFAKLAREMPAFFGVNDHAVIHVQRGAYDIPLPARWLLLATMALPFLLVMALAVPGFAPVVRERYGALLVGFLCFYLALHIVAFGSTRFRLPVLPVLFLLAGRTLDLGIGASWRTLDRAQRALTVAIAATLALSVGANLARTVRHPVFWPAGDRPEAQEGHGAFFPGPDALRAGRGRNRGFPRPPACAKLRGTQLRKERPPGRGPIWSQSVPGVRSTWAPRSPCRILE
jgi:hypothetical protein